jgi:PAS domain S-box-containing protein
MVHQCQLFITAGARRQARRKVTALGFRSLFLARFPLFVRSLRWYRLATKEPVQDTSLRGGITYNIEQPRAVPSEGVLDDGDLLRAVFETTPECIKIVARDGRLLRMNAAGLRMIEAAGWESVENACTFDLIAPEHRSHWLAQHYRVCAGENLAWEFDIIGLNGTRRSMETHAAPIALDDGTTGQLAITRDVTARKQSSAELRQLNLELEEKVSERTRELERALNRLQESERGFELLVDSVTDYAIFMLDPAGQIASWNSGARRIKGYDAEEIIGKHFSCFYSEEDRASDIPMRGLRIAAEVGRSEMEGWRLRKDGSRFWANVIIDAIRSNGQLIGFAKITRDITERRAAESRLRQSQKMEAVGQFTGGAAHDFNNLLMAILGSLEILRKRLPDDARMLALLDNAVQGAKRGTTLTQRMLAFARRQELKHETVELCGLINDMTELLERSLGPTVNIETHFPREPVYVRTDANQLETALLNLAINGRDAMPHGGSMVIAITTKEIAVNHFSNLVPGKYACLSVKDTGHGMDEATLAKATEPFFTTKGVGKGTGLGLSMVDGLAGQSGGKLTVNSVVGQGTTVEIWLPITAEMSPAVSRRLRGVTRIDGASLRSLCVLAVDDDSLVLANVAAMLEDLGHVVVTASSGAKAIEALANRSDIELVISDQAMPGMTGLQLRDAVAKSHPKLPFVLASGYAEITQSMDPSIGRLAKPYTQQELADAVASSFRA